MATPTQYQSNAYGYLTSSITTTQNTGISWTPVSVNGAVLTWAVTAAQILKFTRVTQTKLQIEYMYFPGVTVNATTGIVTSSGTVARNISTTDPTSVADNSPGIAFSAGTLVEMIWSEQAAGMVAIKDAANTFTNDNTIATTKKIYLGDTGNYVTGASGGDITFASNTTAPKTFAQLAAAAGTDEKVKVSATDTTIGYLLAKIPSGNGVTMTQTGGGGNETLVPSINLDTNPGLALASNKLSVKKSSNGLVLDSNGIGLPDATTAGQILKTNGTVWAGATVGIPSLVTADITDSATLTGDNSITTLKTIAIPANTVTKAGSALVIDVYGYSKCTIGDASSGTITLTLSFASQTSTLVLTASNNGSGTDETDVVGLTNVRIYIYFSTVGASASWTSFMSSLQHPTQINSAATVNHTFGTLTNGKATGTADTTGALSILLRGTTAHTGGGAGTEMTLNAYFVTLMPAA